MLHALFCKLDFLSSKLGMYKARALVLWAAALRAPVLCSPLASWQQRETRAQLYRRRAMSPEPFETPVEPGAL